MEDQRTEWHEGKIRTTSAKFKHRKTNKRQSELSLSKRQKVETHHPFRILRAGDLITPRGFFFQKKKSTGTAGATEGKESRPERNKEERGYPAIPPKC